MAWHLQVLAVFLGACLHCANARGPCNGLKPKCEDDSKIRYKNRVLSCVSGARVLCPDGSEPVPWKGGGGGDGRGDGRKGRGGDGRKDHGGDGRGGLRGDGRKGPGGDDRKRPGGDGPGGMGHPSCADGSTPKCEDGSTIKLKTKPPCESGGMPICADGSKPRPPRSKGGGGGNGPKNGFGDDERQAGKKHGFGNDNRQGGHNVKDRQWPGANGGNDRNHGGDFKEEWLAAKGGSDRDRGRNGDGGEYKGPHHGKDGPPPDHSLILMVISISLGAVLAIILAVCGLVLCRMKKRLSILEAKITAQGEGTTQVIGSPVGSMPPSNGLGENPALEVPVYVTAETKTP